MKPPIFDYVAPTSLDEALASLADYGEDAKLLAGGQSLVPLLNFRLARPRYLIDLNGIAALDYIRADDGGLVIGAMTRQRALERSPLVRARCPLVSEAMPWVGHVQIRNRGTIGGSLAHADPAAELPAIVSALDGRLVVRRAGGERVVTPDEFFVSYLTTSLAPAEMLVEVRLPSWTGPRTGHAFIEVSRRHGDFALVGVAALLALDEAGTCTRAAIALTGVGPAPVRSRSAEAALVGARPDPAAFEEAARRVRAAVNPPADIHASADYRRHVSGVLCHRALEAATARARGMEPPRRGVGTA